MQEGLLAFSDLMKKLFGFRRLTAGRILAPSDSRGRRFPAMHALRLFFALLVVWDHSHYIVGLSPRDMLPGIDPGTFAVWAFFFLSGFLVTNSWIHNSDPARFAVHRAARIGPALLAALVFSSLVALGTLGFALTGVGHGFFGTTWGLAHEILHDTIPGAYPGTRYASVLNGSLWSLRWEMAAYLFVLICGVAGMFRKTTIANLGLVLALLLLLADPGGAFLYHGAHATFNVAYVLGEFILGMLLAANFARTSRWWIIMLAAIVLLIGHYAGEAMTEKWSLLAVPALLVYFVSISPIWRMPDLGWDLSYGTYVYAWPVEQWVHWHFPSLGPVSVFLVATPAILVLAAMSWRYLELPVLERAKRYGPARRTVAMPAE